MTWQAWTFLALAVQGWILVFWFTLRSHRCPEDSYPFSGGLQSTHNATQGEVIFKAQGNQQGPAPKGDA